MSRPTTDQERQDILRKYHAGYLSHHPDAPTPEMLQPMTALEAMVILEDESYGLYSGGSGGGPAAEHAWELMWKLAEEEVPRGLRPGPRRRREPIPCAVPRSRSAVRHL